MIFSPSLVRLTLKKSNFGINILLANFRETLTCFKLKRFSDHPCQLEWSIFSKKSNSERLASTCSNMFLMFRKRICITTSESFLAFSFWNTLETPGQTNQRLNDAFTTGVQVPWIRVTFVDLPAMSLGGGKRQGTDWRLGIDMFSNVCGKCQI